jgi:hypothetical protein
MDVEIHITLTEEENEQFLMMLGMAIGAALRNDNKKLGYAFVRLTNKIYAGNPNFKPYAVPEG